MIHRTLLSRVPSRYRIDKLILTRNDANIASPTPRARVRIPRIGINRITRRINSAHEIAGVGVDLSDRTRLVVAEIVIP